MPSDRARISFDPTRDYRSIVVQQGRVTLEADSNEQTTLASEALRLETIDIIGPAGTPDDGYAVAINKANDGLTIGKGTMYAGGWRMTLPHTIEMTKQPDWIDRTAAPLPTGNSIIALLVTEQTVGAIEDQPLREVALGGPDTAARTRLMQRFVAIQTSDDTCPAAAKDLAPSLSKMGLAIDEDTLELTSTAALKVSFFKPTKPVDPCCPTPQGGYFGADNQLIRVTVTDYDPATKTGTLLWGWNDASFLYRAKLAGPSGGVQTLTLSPPPIDAEHTPQPSQVVEVLRASRVLDDIDGGNYIAAREGQVVPLDGTTVFIPGTNVLTLPSAALPDAYQDNAFPLFLRLWQAQVTFNEGEATQLDAVNGISVAIKIAALPTGDLAMRPVWNFAVRPSTPQKVYPERYKNAFQPPSAPRQWLCDLEIVSAAADNSDITLLADCRLHFLPLTEQTSDGGCCGITLGPDDVTSAGGLQAVVDAQAASNASLSLKPGTYQLDAPLALTAQHNGLVLSGCGKGVILEAAANSIAAFGPGLITITGASTIALSSLTLSPPPVSSVSSDPTAQSNFTFLTMIGLGVDGVNGLTVQDCEFVFSEPGSDSTGADAPDLAAAGIFLQGNCSALNITQNTFESATAISAADLLSRYVVGIWFTPTALTAKSQQDNNIYSLGYVAPLNHILDNTQITGNTFVKMTLGAVIYAELGHITCTGNRVRDSLGGLWFVDSGTGPFIELFEQIKKTANSLLGPSLPEVNDGLESLIRFVAVAGLLVRLTDPDTQTSTTTDLANPGFVESASAETRNIIVSNYVARAADTYKLLAADPDTNAEPADAPAATAATDVKTDQDPAAEAAPFANINAIDSLRNIYTGFTLIPKTTETVLAIRDNDIALVTNQTAAEQKDNPKPTLFGLLALYAGPDTAFERDQDPDTKINTETVAIAALFLDGNRIQVPNERSIGLFSYWEADTLFTGNLIRQNLPRIERPAYAAIVLTSSALELIATGNIVHATWLIRPLRDLPASSTGQWVFHNTVSQLP